MTFLRTLAAASAVAFLAMPAAAEKLSLNAISNYLNGLTSAKGAFTQINDDGTISTGTIYIKRPGKVRFEYNPPEQALVLAYAGEVAIFDKKTGQGPDRYPLARTPLSIILDRNVNLARANMVTAQGYDGTATTVTAQDPDHPEYGNIQLKFTGPPVQLRQWIIRDDSGSTTTVVLGDLEEASGLSNRIFDINAEVAKMSR
ncbi:LolA family protein [Primorskyibacter flagellatus]|uniref:Outer membrane lipoprotein-sorting protein n=1 Tax=Primorskyibacter flagellatus TaxID=1387277 RepID=A0A1W1ZW19_9RHOB|nr:outer membrane lipoprotein carrier protein LolA [Primorskyibacter flagellatus]SMC52546.1 Outer membrane lipoprotein-sorting protein [Primorskyibacter flagellatus]